MLSLLLLLSCYQLTILNAFESVTSIELYVSNENSADSSNTAVSATLWFDSMIYQVQMNKPQEDTVYTFNDPSPIGQYCIETFTSDAKIMIDNNADSVYFDWIKFTTNTGAWYGIDAMCCSVALANQYYGWSGWEHWVLVNPACPDGYALVHFCVDNVQGNCDPYKQIYYFDTSKANQYITDSLWESGLSTVPQTTTCEPTTGASTTKTPTTKSPTTSTTTTDTPTTNRPSSAPTMVPSTAPSNPPSIRPTMAPSSLPSHVPTNGPNIAPNMVPIRAPSNAPSNAPSRINFPSNDLTDIPSNAAIPTQSPITSKIPITLTNVGDAPVYDDTMQSSQSMTDAMQSRPKSNSVILLVFVVVASCVLPLVICSCVMRFVIIPKWEEYKLGKAALSVNTQDTQYVTAVTHNDSTNTTSTQLHKLNTNGFTMNDTIATSLQSEASEQCTESAGTNKGEMVSTDNVELCMAEKEPGDNELSNNTDVRQREDSYESMYDNEGIEKETPQTKGNTTEATPKGKPLRRIVRMKTPTGGAGGTRQKCVDCAEVKNGKIYEDDGLFYCWQCWAKYEAGDNANHVTMQ
eukprot:159170_1